MIEKNDSASSSELLDELNTFGIVFPLNLRIVCEVLVLCSHSLIFKRALSLTDLVHTLKQASQLSMEIVPVARDVVSRVMTANRRAISGWTTSKTHEGSGYSRPSRCSSLYSARTRKRVFTAWLAIRRRGVYWLNGRRDGGRRQP